MKTWVIAVTLMLAGCGGGSTYVATYTLNIPSCATNPGGGMNDCTLTAAVDLGTETITLTLDTHGGTLPNTGWTYPDDHTALTSARPLVLHTTAPMGGYPLSNDPCLMAQSVDLNGRCFISLAATPGLSGPNNVASLSMNGTVPQMIIDLNNHYMGTFIGPPN